jgi:LDH2 family malate/lactate/ureidoglycolate dehydrogenase
VSDRSLPFADLVTFGTDILRRLEVPAEDAALVAHSLVTADAWGHPSHGLLRLAWYVERLRARVMTATTQPRTLLDGGAVAVLDGGEGIGQVITAHAALEAVRRAEEHGVGVVAVRNSNHFGTAAYFTRMMAERGCVGILTTNGSPAMAPWGGREKTVGANPWSVATPGGSHGPVVLDIANTVVARGKIYAAAERGESLPAGWALSGEAAPTTDPRVAIDGLILPMAGHKGYGISFMMDVLSGVLTGSSYATDIAGPHVPDRRSGCGHLLLALKIDSFLPEQEFDRRIDDLIERTKAVPLAQGFDEIHYPGELEDRRLQTARTGGVHLPDKTWAGLALLAESAGVPLPAAA